MRIEENSWLPQAHTLGFLCEEDMLKSLYVEQSLSIKQIAHILGYSTFSVRSRLIRLGITLRSRGGKGGKLGRRRLAHLSIKELFESNVTLLVDKYKVNPSTVSNERALRRKEILKLEQATVLPSSAS